MTITLLLFPSPYECIVCFLYLLSCFRLVSFDSRCNMVEKEIFDRKLVWFEGGQNCFWMDESVKLHLLISLFLVFSFAEFPPQRAGENPVVKMMEKVICN
ncbi:hypothetical protein L1987_45631 [Smallanthus sonchifolius]|uniref:Uncharacterized protein n=1 Tax=Smallanthus sonchifolius TaxID=185202 RepID=A0ACB9FXL7_9ASTR|nr:hypothetical protein L1987_45631 [Smallanthus sonchifolius]